MSNNVNISKGLSFDSSLSNFDAVVSPAEYRDRLVSLLQPILDARFSGNVGKQRIRPYKDRITFACPYCMDSMKSNHKKRGNFILSGKFANFFKCHNCDEFKRIDRFFDDFKISLDLNVINYISQNITDFAHETDSKYDISLFLDMGEIEKYAIDRNEFKAYFGLSEIKNSSVAPWLRRRLQFDESKFLYNETKKYLAVLNLTPSGKILGIQRRTFKGENKYLTYILSKLYELMKKDPKTVPDEMNAISQIFNICLINYTRPITLFEGPLDSFLFKNSIANGGIHKHFPFEISLRYWFDDDKDGRNKSIEKINNGESVFLWEKCLRDISAPPRKKWDLNDLCIFCKTNSIKLPNFELYFSNDPLDMIDL